jgi:hypothetical protein
LILLVQAGLLAVQSSQTSFSSNEPAHLVAGLSHWRFGAFDLYRVNPPLIRTVAAAPVAIAGYVADFGGFTDYPGARPVFAIGEAFVHDNGRRSLWLMTLARWACIPFSLLGGWICFLWARDLFGPAAGLVACALWCFSPMVLGIGATIAPDAHAAALGVAACYTFWRWLKSPTWAQAVLTGVVLGLAELAKTTMILFYPIWPLIWVAYRIGETRPGPESPILPQAGGLRFIKLRQWIREAGMLAVRMLIGIYVLNLGYLGEGAFTPLKEYRFVSEMFGGENVQQRIGGNRFADSWLGHLPVPFPKNYIVGIDVQQRDFENYGFPSYLGGRYAEHGWWYYYVYAVLVKSPLGTLGLLLLSVAVCFTRFAPPIRWYDAMVLLAPPLVIFVVVSMKSGFSHHSRYILPCLPFVFVWLGQFGKWIQFTVDSCPLIPSPSPPQSRGRREPEIAGSLLGVVSAALLAWSIGSSLLVFPHSLAYFNELAGGPRNGANHLLNSNLDWGQDLLFLEKWIQRNADGEPVHLAFCNLYNPFDLEIEGIQPWPFQRGSASNAPGDKSQHVQDGYYAISVNLLYDFPWPVRDRGGATYSIDLHPHAHLRSIEPVGWAGYSIRIFSAQQMRAAFEASAMTLWE